MPATKNAERWIATVDERRARLFRCTHTTTPQPRPPPTPPTPLPAHGRWRLEEQPALVNLWEADHERGRPSMLQRGPGTAPPHVAGFGHEEEEEHRRFAHDVVKWLEKQAGRTGDEPLVVFAASRFLGLLRASLPAPLARRVVTLDKELSGLTPAALAEHPAVTGVLAGTPHLREGVKG